MPDTVEHQSIADAPPRGRVSDRAHARPLRQEKASQTGGHGRWWRDARRRRMLAAADLCAGLLAVGVVAVPLTGSLWPLVLAPLWPLTSKFFGLYDRDHRALRHLTADEIPTLLAWTSSITIAAALLMTVTPAGDLSAFGVGSLFAVAFLGAVGLRSLARWSWWRMTPPELVGMVGDPPVLESLRRKVGMFRELHFELADERRIDALGGGDERSIELNALASGVDRIVVAASGVQADLIGELKDICRRRQVKLSVVSPLRGKALPSDRMAQVADLPILEYNTWDPSRSTMLIKRAFDVLMAGTGLLLFAPFFAVIAILIKLDSPGPVIFSQIRAGQFGRPFRMYKMRTMSVDAEAQLEGLIDIQELDDPVFKLRDDPRVTRAGRILRRYSLDEVPQLLNVLLGEMSMVGPRPEQVELVERYSGDELAKLAAKPGVTGPMQVFGRGELTFDERVEMELEYVENVSLSRDMRILVHTIPAVVRGTGAF